MSRVRGHRKMTCGTFTVLVASTLLAIAVADNKSCYWPDGSLTDSGTQPCNTTSAVSACCDPRDSCTTSGICLGASGWIYRSGCTDPTWQSSECPSQCHTDPILKTPYSSFAAIYPCVAGLFPNQFCCGSYATSNANCCGSNFTLGNTGLAFKAGADAVQAQLSSLSAAVVSATISPSIATVTTTTTATSTPSGSSSSSNSFSNLSTAIGAGIGVPLGILAIGLLAFLVWRERRRNQDPNRINARWVPPNTARSGYSVENWNWGGSTAPMRQHSGSVPLVGSPYAGPSPLHQGEQAWGPLTPPKPPLEVSAALEAQVRVRHELDVARK